jgi:hypothetical protein
MEEVMGGEKVPNMDGEGKAMADACGCAAFAMVRVLWIVAAIAGRRRHG